jgi:hypothetical protein
MNRTIPIGIAGAALVAACTFDSQPKCDSPDAVATIKNMTLEKINGNGGDSFLRIHSIYDRDKKIAGNTYPDDLTIDSFRKRGDIGKGSSCAAQIGLRVSGSDKISVEYMIEPTTDGKTIITARFL